MTASTVPAKVKPKRVRNPGGPQGRPRIDWPKFMNRIEKAGAKGHNNPTAICNVIGVSPQSLRDASEDIKQEFSERMLKGNATWTDTLLNHTSERVLKNDILLMFALKQQHGANWSDHRKVEYSGAINYNITTDVMPAIDHKPQDAAIDITPTSEPAE